MKRVIPLVLALTIHVALHAQERLVPLTDMGSRSYRGYAGGLYPGGSNTMPPQHAAAGARATDGITPLDTSGVSDPRGSIVLLSIGMSNATQEYSQFKVLADADTLKSSRVVVVDGAQGGQTAAIIERDTAKFWSVVADRLKAAGVTAKQVQVVWLKEANAQPRGSFPGHADTLARQLARIAQILHKRYPNVRVCYLSSRTYGGYATSLLNPEPYAYESGFSVRWTIERQIAGDTALACEGPNVRSPWLAWGPYLWADSTNPRSDGLLWVRDDFVSDGTHPSTSGRLKVARLLLNFFTTDSLASQWFVGARDSAQLSLPSAVLPVAPADSALVPANQVTFTWRPSSPEVDRYMLEIVASAGMYRYVDSANTGTDATWNPPPSGGTYRWRVRAHNASGWGYPGPARYLQVQDIGAAPGAGGVPRLMAIWPTPVVDHLNVKFSAPLSLSATIELIDQAGHIRVSTYMPSGANSARIDAREIESGCYGVEVRAGERVERRMVVVLK